MAFFNRKECITYKDYPIWGTFSVFACKLLKKLTRTAEYNKFLIYLILYTKIPLS